MFTGIVEEVGSVADISLQDRQARVHIACTRAVEEVAVGDSISVNGCCLTVTELTDAGFTADVIAQTLAVTTLGSLTVGATVNLERAARVDARLGGHLVQGHVDGVGTVVAREQAPGTVFLSVQLPQNLVGYVVERGSISIAGVSLTVAAVAEDVVTVGLIPHTVAATTFSTIAVGDEVNLEADVIAKYVERLLAAGLDSPYLQER